MSQAGVPGGTLNHIRHFVTGVLFQLIYGAAFRGGSRNLWEPPVPILYKYFGPL